MKLKDVVIAMQQARIAELERFVRWVAWHSCQRDIGREAHRLLGHKPNPLTVGLLADEPGDDKTTVAVGA